jgi:HAD superfamily hydrolase (TIGR01490 family)
VTRWGRRWFADRRRAEGFYLADTRDALRRHRTAGAAVILVSGSFPAVLEPIAEAVGATRILCTRPECRDGVLTGGIVGEPVIGEAKRQAVREVLANHPHIDPADCFAYGDHVSDLPMLAEVGYPVVVGDCPELLERLPGAVLQAVRARPARTGGG